MVSQTTALWVFAVAALAYIAWIDARPTFWKWQKGKAWLRWLGSHEASDAKTTPSWLEQLADDDDREMWPRVVQDSRWNGIKVALEAPDPYIDIEFKYFNGTVYNLYFERLEGRLKYNGHDLQYEPKPLRYVTILHANSGDISVRQHLSRDTAQDMLKIIGNGGHPELSVGNFAVHFFYTNRGDVRRSLRMAGAGAFKIGVDPNRIY